MAKTLKPGRKPVQDKKVGLTIYVPGTWKKKIGSKILKAATEAANLEAFKAGLK